MNELSWLLYAADFAGDVESVCGFIFFGGTIALAVYSVAKGMAKIAYYGVGDDKPVTPSIATVGKALILPVALAAVIGIVTPSKDTVYAIAASELGEKALASPTAGKAIQALNSWLDRQIAQSAEPADQ